MRTALFLFLLFLTTPGFSQKLIIIEQDFNRAFQIADKENKLLFIDFYTDWCEPCKKLDKWIFRNDTISEKLSDDFVLLRYNAENDTTFNLAKKYHINSYPTGVILNNSGYVINRKYGFPGDSIKEKSEIFFAFTNEAISLNNQNQFLKGYSNAIDISMYPEFYRDYVNRTITTITANKEFDNYWKKPKDIFSEYYYSTLAYFAAYVPENAVATFLRNKEKYIQLFGQTEVNVILFFFVVKKFEAAIAEKSKKKFEAAKEFSKKVLGIQDAALVLPLFEAKFNDSKNK